MAQSPQISLTISGQSAIAISLRRKREIYEPSLYVEKSKSTWLTKPLTESTAWLMASLSILFELTSKNRTVPQTGISNFSLTT